jgi:aspartokinase
VSDLKIKMFKNNESDPKTTITIPGKVLTVASKLIPKQAVEALQEKGIDINALIELSKKPDVQGTIIEVEDHKKQERIVIALE